MPRCEVSCGRDFNADINPVIAEELLRRHPNMNLDYYFMRSWWAWVQIFERAHHLQGKGTVLQQRYTVCREFALYSPNKLTDAFLYGSLQTCKNEKIRRDTLLKFESEDFREIMFTKYNEKIRITSRPRIADASLPAVISEPGTIPVASQKPNMTPVISEPGTIPVVEAVLQLPAQTRPLLIRECDKHFREMVGALDLLSQSKPVKRAFRSKCDLPPAKRQLIWSPYSELFR